MKKLWKKTQALWSVLWRQLKDRTNIIIFVCVLAVVYSPTWLVGLLGLILRNGSMLGIATAYAAFWAGPFTPFFPVVFGITFAIRKVVDKIHKR